eukprot:g15493.t1
MGVCSSSSSNDSAVSKATSATSPEVPKAVAAAAAAAASCHITAISRCLSLHITAISLLLVILLPYPCFLSHYCHILVMSSRCHPYRISWIKLGSWWLASTSNCIFQGYIYFAIREPHCLSLLPCHVISLHCRFLTTASHCCLVMSSRCIFAASPLPFAHVTAAAAAASRCIVAASPLPFAHVTAAAAAGADASAPPASPASHSTPGIATAASDEPATASTVKALSLVTAAAAATTTATATRAVAAAAAAASTTVSPAAAASAGSDVVEVLTRAMDKVCRAKKQDLRFYLPPSAVAPDLVEGVSDEVLGASSVLSAVSEFQTSSDVVLLLLGEPGAGKTLTTLQLVKDLLAVFRERTTGPAAPAPGELWFPFLTSLKDKTGEQVKGQLDSELLGLLRESGLSAEAALGQLRLLAQGQTDVSHTSHASPASLTSLYPKLLYIMDGVDEMRTFNDQQAISDIFQHCGAAGWGAGRIKVVLTCRVRHMNSEREKTLCAHKAQGRSVASYMLRLLLPFSLQQVRGYIHNRTSNNNNNDDDDDNNSSKSGAETKDKATVQLLSAEGYEAVLAGNPHVQEIVQNPFVLRLFVEALPGMLQGQQREQTQQTQQPGQTDQIASPARAVRFSRFDIYDAFVSAWLAAERARLGMDHLQNGENNQSTDALADLFGQFCETLALKMFSDDLLSVCLDVAATEANATESGLAGVCSAMWAQLQVAVGKMADKASKMAEQAASSADKAATSTHTMHTPADIQAANNPLARFLRTGPLVLSVRGGQCVFSFIHKSFFEYFAARLVLRLGEGGQGGVSGLSVAVDRAAPAALLLSAGRPIQHEPVICRFLAELRETAHGTRRKQVIDLETALFQVLDRCRAERQSASQGLCANVLTMLNHMGVSLSRRALHDLDAAGADLSLCMLDSADLHNTDLRRANLRGAWLRQANFGGAQLDGADFGELPYLPYDQSVSAMAIYSPDKDNVESGSKLAVACGQLVALRTLCIGAESKQITKLSGHSKAVNALAFSPTGDRLASAADDLSVLVWDMTATERLDPLLKLSVHSKAVRALAFSPDGQRLASAGADRSILVWHAVSGMRLLELKGHTDVVNSLVFSPDGKTLASGSADKSMRVWDVDTGQQLQALTGHSRGVPSVAYSPDGKILAACMHKAIRLWDMSSSEAVIRLDLQGHTALVNAAVFLPDGKRVASISWDNSARVWDIQTGRLKQEFKGHTKAVSCVVCSADGHRLFTGSNDKTVRLWDLAGTSPTGQVERKAVGHSEPVNTLAFAPDGRVLVTGSNDRTIGVWDTATFASTALLRGHTQWVNAVKVSPDGRTIASGSSDMTVRLWDAASGAELHVLKGHRLGVTSVAFSVDGLAIGAGNDEGVVKLWTVATGAAQEDQEGYLSAADYFLATAAQPAPGHAGSDVAVGTPAGDLPTAAGGGGLDAVPVWNEPDLKDALAAAGYSRVSSVAWRTPSASPTPAETSTSTISNSAEPAGPAPGGTSAQFAVGFRDGSVALLDQSFCALHCSSRALNVTGLRFEQAVMSADNAALLVQRAQA